MNVIGHLRTRENERPKTRTGEEETSMKGGENRKYQVEICSREDPSVKREFCPNQVIMIYKWR